MRFSIPLANLQVLQRATAPWCVFWLPRCCGASSRCAILFDCTLIAVCRRKRPESKTRCSSVRRRFFFSMYPIMPPSTFPSSWCKPIAAPPDLPVSLMPCCGGEGGEGPRASLPSTNPPPTTRRCRCSGCPPPTATARAIAAPHGNEPALDLTVKSDPDHWAKQLGGRVLATGSVRVNATGAVSALAGFAEGAWWVQDAGASLPARLLGDVRGRRVA